jgi:hypothetical protein
VNYGCINFTYKGKQQEEFIEWSEKRIDDEIARYLQRHLQSKSAKPADVLRIQAVAGGDHGDTAFQFGASVSGELSGGEIIDFEVSVCELICQKDTGRLIKSTILPTLTSGLKVVATSPLHIYEDDEGNIICNFGENLPTTQHIATTIPHVDLYITGDLAFQALALGKESMSGHWCTQCTMQMQCTLTEVQLSDVKLWTIAEYCRLGDEAERRGKGETKLGVKATATAAYASANDTNTETDEINLRTLDEFQNREFVEKISKARKMLTDQKLKLKTMRTSKVKDQQSIEKKIFKVLEEIGVELSSYHGGSLNGKDIRKVMTNAGKRSNCILADTNINALCMQFCEVFVLWDGAFSLARTINPIEIDCSTYRMYVRAAVKGSKDLRCTGTPKVHLMLEHVEWQMTNIRGGVR